MLGVRRCWAAWQEYWRQKTCPAAVLTSALGAAQAFCLRFQEFAALLLPAASYLVPATTTTSLIWPRRKVINSHAHIANNCQTDACSEKPIRVGVDLKCSMVSMGAPRELHNTQLGPLLLLRMVRTPESPALRSPPNVFQKLLWSWAVPNITQVSNVFAQRRAPVRGSVGEGFLNPPLRRRRRRRSALHLNCCPPCSCPPYRRSRSRCPTPPATVAATPPGPPTRTDPAALRYGWSLP